MGTCNAKNKKKPYVIKKQLEERFQQKEIQLLYLIYQDLASRNADNLVNKTSFTDFFTMIGLWGDLVFDYFKSDQVNFEQFLEGIAYFIKCDDDQKLQHLFALYDLEKLGVVKKTQFLQMLQNYPREDIIKLLDDPKFLEDLKIMKYYERKAQINERKAAPLKSGEQEMAESVHAIQTRQSQSKIPLSKRGSLMSIGAIDEQSVVMMFPNESLVGPNGIPLGQLGQNLSFNINGKMIELKRVNVNYLIHKYVDMIYKKKAKYEEELSLQEFKEFVQNHPKLFDGLYKAFNYDIWGIDLKTQLPLFKHAQIDVEGILIKQSSKNQKKQSERYFILIQRTCLSFKNKNALLPTKIYCLDGLTIQEQVENNKYGFEISHKDKLYFSKKFICRTFEDYKKWTLHMQMVQKSSVNEYYSILQKVGDGKFSTVYQCQSKQSKEILAIKIIEKFKLSKAEKQLLAHEVEIMKILNHSCIIKFHELIESKTHINIITELVKDGDLFDYVVNRENLNEYEAAQIMSQLFDTINYIHSVGIVHRDLKPENIMIILDQQSKQVKQVKIIDFGFANFLTNIQHKEGEVLVGTTNYLAPESLQQKKLDYKVDNFALGVIMYFLLSGFLPFDAPFPEEILKNILEQNYNMDDSFWQQITDDAKELVRLLLNADPKDRLSLDDALRHEWIKNRDKLPKTKVQRQQHKIGFY